MKTKDVKIDQVVTYYGHTLKQNGNVDLTLKARYSELPNTLLFMQLLNNDITIEANIQGHNKKLMLGMFRLKDVRVSHDGESTIKFNSLNDFVEMDNLNLLVLNDDVKEFKIKAKAKVELEDFDDVNETEDFEDSDEAIEESENESDEWADEDWDDDEWD